MYSRCGDMFLRECSWRVFLGLENSSWGYCRVNKLHDKWINLVFITLPEVDGVGERSLKYFMIFKVGQMLRFKMVSASIWLLFLIWSEMPKLCVKEYGSALWLFLGHSQSPKHCWSSTGIWGRGFFRVTEQFTNSLVSEWCLALFP